MKKNCGCRSFGEPTKKDPDMIGVYRQQKTGAYFNLTCKLPIYLLSALETSIL